MALYKSTGTKNSSGQDIQEPNPSYSNKKRYYNSSLLVVCGSVAKRADHILINNTGSYAFNYTNASAVGTKTAFTAAGNKEYVTGSFVTGRLTAGGSGSALTPIRLDIQPVAWRRTDGVNEGLDTSVTFVYRGK